MEELEKIKGELEQISRYARRVSLNRTVKPKKGLVYLAELEKEIQKLRNVRYHILQVFKSDVLETLVKYDKNATIQFNSKELMQGDFLKLQFSLQEEEVNCLVSRDRIEDMDQENHLLNEGLPKIYPCINGLFRIYENASTRNILSNDLFNEEDPLYVHLDQTIKKLLISGNGVTLPVLEFTRFQFTPQEKSELIGYYYRNLQQILRRLYVLNDFVLDSYRLTETRRKILSLYKGGK